MAEGTTRNGVHRPGGLAKARVVVLGGGFGGLETAFDLRLLARDRAGITFSEHAAERDPGLAEHAISMWTPQQLSPTERGAFRQLD